MCPCRASRWRQMQSEAFQPSLCHSHGECCRQNLPWANGARRTQRSSQTNRERCSRDPGEAEDWRERKCSGESLRSNASKYLRDQIVTYLAAPMRLPRPHISIEIRCIVALRQLGENSPTVVVNDRRRSLGGLSRYLTELLETLATSFGCQVRELRLDHRPALALRQKVFRDGIHVDYVPSCDSPDDLIYLSHSDHLIKTNGRGEHGQHPDRVLIKKHKRLERGPRPKRPSGLTKKPGAPKQKWPSRPFNSKRKSPK